jgi:flavin reductase (DIM6/NTAB) family NADH-FMN oxidoreductase RutF
MKTKERSNMKKSFGAKTLIFPAPVWCVATYDSGNVPNIMTIAWGGICCSDPPCVNISLRKATYTYGNIMERKAFTLSVPSQKQGKEADYFGMASGRNENKFKKTGITPVKSELVDAPWPKEFSMVLECEMIHNLEIGLHTLFVGRILDVKIDESVLNDKDEPDINLVDPLLFTPSYGGYYGVGRFAGQSFDIGKGFMKKD